LDLILAQLQLFGGVLLALVVLFPVFLLLGAGWYLGSRAIGNDALTLWTGAVALIPIVFAGVAVWKIFAAEISFSWLIAALTAAPVILLFLANVTINWSLYLGNGTRTGSIFKTSISIWISVLSIAYLFVASQLLQSEFGISI
jgi:hypothetical protein